MTAYTRVVVLGTQRRATMVVPSDEPIAAHLAPLADAVAEPFSAERLSLVDPQGIELDIRRSLDDLGVLDGSALRLVRGAEAPAPPEVTDVTDAVADARAMHARTWSPWHRHLVAAAAAGLATATSLGALSSEVLWPAYAAWGALTLAAITSGLVRHHDARVVLTGASVGAALAPTVGALTDATALDMTLTASLSTTLVWCTLALATGGAGRHKGALTGSAVGGLLALASLTALLLGADTPRTAAVIGAVAVLGLGLVPALALGVSGLTRLDDQSSLGAGPRRATVADGVTQAYSAMTWTVIALALTLGIATAVLLSTGTLWGSLIGASLALIAVLRTRVTPLVPQAWALWIAGVGGLMLGAWLADIQALLWAIAAAVLVGALLLALVEPAPHTRIRMRRAGDLVEAVAAIALLPLLLGMFGVYSFMLGVFA